MTFSRSSSSLHPHFRITGLRLRVLLDLHHPAAGELALGLQVHRPLFLENLEGARPEPQPEDVAFPRQQVVIHIESRHRLQVAPDDAVGDELGDLGGIGSTVLDVVERCRAYLQPRLVFVVPLRDARVQIPAVIVEAPGVGDSTDAVEVGVLQLAEAHDHVCHLHAGVVDVVLHLDGYAAEALDPHQRVTECGVSKVTDVCRLVWVDGGVLDDRLRLRGW